MIFVNKKSDFTSIDFILLIVCAGTKTLESIAHNNIKIQAIQPSRETFYVKSKALMSLKMQTQK